MTDIWPKRLTTNPKLTFCFYKNTSSTLAKGADPSFLRKTED